MEIHQVSKQEQQVFLFKDPKKCFIISLSRSKISSLYQIINKKLLRFNDQWSGIKSHVHQKLKDNDAFQEKLGQTEIIFQNCRLLSRKAGLLLDSVGSKHLHTFMAVSQCKAHIPKACKKIIDQCIQAFNVEGVTDDQPLAIHSDLQEQSDLWMALVKFIQDKFPDLLLVSTYSMI